MNGPPRSSRGLCPSSFGEWGRVEAARNCSGRRRRPAEILPRGGTLPHAELESGVSVGSSDLEVKTTTRVRVTPQRIFRAQFRNPLDHFGHLAARSPVSQLELESPQ